MAKTDANKARRGGLGSRLTVQQWFLLVLAAMGLLVVVCAVVGGILLDRTAKVSNRLADSIAPAQSQAYRLRAALAEQQLGVRGYMVTGDRRFLEPFEHAVDDRRAATDQLTDLLSDNERLMADTRAVEEAVTTWRTRYAEPMMAKVRKDGPEAVRSQDFAQGEQLIRNVRVATQAQERDLLTARTEARADLDRMRQLRDAAFMVMFAMFLATGVLLAVVLHYMVGRPLGRLRAGSGRVADGELDHVIEPSGPADLREVTAVVEKMRQSIVAELMVARDREAVLARQTADLDAQTIELRRSNAELEQFAYVASHDLQEPLRKVASFCQMLERRYGDQLDERGTQYIAFAVDGAKRMQTLINDLLTFSRVGRMLDARQRVNLDRLLDKAVTNLSTVIQESDGTIERPDRMPELTGDPMLLTMLWQNLIGNAVKFRHPDRLPVVRIICEERDDFYEFIVADNGIGIPEEFADKVFVIFQRLHGRDSYSGTGIGLALCKKVAEYHGGRIWLDTTQDEGTRVHFTLPREPADAVTDAVSADDATGVVSGAAIESAPESEPAPKPDSQQIPDPAPAGESTTADAAVRRVFE